MTHPPVITISASTASADTVLVTSPYRSSRHDATESSSITNDTSSLKNATFAPQTETKLESLTTTTVPLAPLSDAHIFQDPTLATHWLSIYTSTRYENRHRLDPAFTWTLAEEKTLLRKVDTRILIWSWVMFMSLDLVRKNVFRALPDNFLGDLNMNQDDLNNGHILGLIAFLCAELPSGLVSKKVGAGIWVPMQICAWAIVCACQAALKGKAGFFVTRVLLGLCEGGFTPDCLLYLSYWYTGKELNTRLSWFYTVLGVSQILGSLLAAGFLEMRGLHGLAGWQWLFLFEALISAIIGLLSFFILAAGPTQTKGILRKRGWFNEHEEKILVNRVLRDDPTKGDMNNRQGISWSSLWSSLGEKDLWPVYLLGLVLVIPLSPPSTYLSLTLKQLGFSTLQSNLLCIPSQFWFALNVVPYAWLSTKLNERGILASVSSIWTLAFLIPLYLLHESDSSRYAWTRYALTICLCAAPFCHPFLIGWASQNSTSVRNRTVALCLYNMSVQIGTVVSTQIYRDNDKPYYRKGNLALIVIAAFGAVLCWVVKMYYVLRNKQKRRVWEAMEVSERIEYKRTAEVEGTKRLDVFFVH